MKVYEQGGFVVYKSSREHTIHNTQLPFSEAHCHGIVSLKMCMRIIDNVIHKKMPQTHCQYLLESHIRLTEDEGYREKLILLRDRRGQSQQFYFNPRKGKVL